MDKRYEGTFEAVSPAEKNHGPVVVVDKEHLAYADGTPYYSIGTTCYAWVHQTKELQEQTLESLKNSPYDKWGINEMCKEACDAYLRYVTARYSAYRNVWWSLANEYNFIVTKTPADWERYGQLVSSKDVYHHLLSVHNGEPNYDFSRPWITHCSLQRVDFYKTTEETDVFLEKYHKPVVWDEICYEGNIFMGWGNISGQELVRRFWEAFIRGGHCGHGETFLDPNDILWWSKGGILKGESAPRLQFLLNILKETPGGYLKKIPAMFDEVAGCSAQEPIQESEVAAYDYCIHYLGLMCPKMRMVILPEDADYQVEIIDTWNMTIEDKGLLRGFQMVELPGNPYMAIRIRKGKV